MAHVTVSDIDAATIMLDMRDALGDNPSAVPAVTKRQRQVLQVHLIEDRSQVDAAKILGISWRGVMLTEATALQNILDYLQGVQSPSRNKQWRPWMKALLRDETLSLSDLSAKIGKSELAIKIKMSRLRKENEAIPFRPRTRSRRTA